MITPPKQEAEALAALVRQLNQGGHNPATSGNYSLRQTDQAPWAWISESGIDKSTFSAENLLPVDCATGQLHPDFAGRRSSDETELHLAIYRATNAGAVLHSHFLEGLLFADQFPGQDNIRLGGLELLKGFAGVKTHEAEVLLPCFENSQDVPKLAEAVTLRLKAPDEHFGFLLRGHGLYVWGRDVKEAKRHLEVFEYIIKYYVLSQRNLR
ncbi:MAG: methylthioribulose 1-phosphate dehydratase [bacterium]|nr:methylthioribulose 1-phosphate dehydratase [bacterium]